MCGTPLIAFSIGDATVCSTTSAEAPGYTALTVTTGGAISGYCAIGRWRIAERPASTRNTEITAAKIGRSIKKRENIFLPSLRLLLRRRGGGRWRRLGRLVRLAIRRLGRHRSRCGGRPTPSRALRGRAPPFDKRPRPQLRDPLSEHPFARREPALAASHGRSRRRGP